MSAKAASSAVTTATPSLRLRVVLVVLGLLAVLLVLLGLSVDLVVENQAGRDLHDRLTAAVDRAEALVRNGSSTPDIAGQLNGGGIRARLVTATGAAYGDPTVDADGTWSPPPLPPPGPPPPAWDGGPGSAPRPPGPPNPLGPPGPPPDATATVVTHRLPDGSTLTLVADTTTTTALLRQLRVIMAITALVVLALAAVGLTVLVGTTMRPLQRLTGVAESIAAGDRGRRLRPDRPSTELGRAAIAFDTMLDRLEDSETRARTAARAAARAEASTRTFLADAAHELRTPIAGMHAASQQIIAASGEDDDQQRHRANLVLTEARRAARLVEDMLDLSRIDAGLRLDRQRFDLAALVETERSRTALLAPSMEVRYDGPATLPLTGDPARITQILANLTDNARRHTPAGGRITLGLSSAGPVARLTVTDTGPGVPDTERERVFERLVRLDDARDRDRGGAGLGLSIARALARAHGGDLVCADHFGGARFELSLPVG